MSTAEANVAPGTAWNDPASARAPQQRGAHAIAQTIGSKILIQAINAGTGIITARALMPAGRGQLAFAVVPRIT